MFYNTVQPGSAQKNLGHFLKFSLGGKSVQTFVQVLLYMYIIRAQSTNVQIHLSTNINEKKYFLLKVNEKYDKVKHSLKKESASYFL